jgi:DNA-binding transcriptional LysR family regulator
MNVHHLELFYYVARHGGIMPVVRKMPYGIQQPAISAQVAQLEEYLGVTLFQRRPFALTPAGEKLYDFISPFFSNLDRVAAEFQGGQTRQFRIGASTIILRNHLPRLLQGVHKKFPELKVSLREGYPDHLEMLLQRDEVDLIITLITQKPAAGLQSLVLLKLPPVLLVPKNSPLKNAAELWARDRIMEPLICLPAGEVLTKDFQNGLRKLGVEWFPAIEASSIDMIETYVAAGLGIGVAVGLPPKNLSPQVRSLPLPDFPPAIIGAVWRGKLTPLLQAFLDEAKSQAREFI